jgi:16S rRNA (uracil1498-N3)-methyltransferase
MRKRVGEKIQVIDGSGSTYYCEITNIANDEIVAIIKETVGSTYLPQHCLAIAPPKNIDRLEWLVEKATEIGIAEIFLINTERTEHPKVKLDRINKIIISAMKQSKNIKHPIVSGITDLKVAWSEMKTYSKRFIAHCNNSEKPLKEMGPFDQPSLIMIGPEGDFSKKEVDMAIEHGFLPVSLGTPRFRTETAGLVGMVTLNQ